MSGVAVRWVWGLEGLGCSETLVLLALADRADGEGRAVVSQAGLARMSRQSERSVRRVVARLREMGLVVVERRSSRSGRRSNLYRLGVGASPG